MIQNFSPNREYDLGRTTGCSCCSGDLKDKEQVLKEVRDNIRVAKEVSEFYKIPFSKLIKDVLIEKKCKKHKSYKKYSFKDEESWYCWKCDKHIETIKKNVNVAINEGEKHGSKN